MPTFTQKFEDFLDNNHPGGYMSTSISISDSDLDARISQNINNRGFLTSTSHLPWSQIDNKPTIFSGNYNDLRNKPSLFSGNYNDLSNKPIIPTISISNTLNEGTRLATITINGVDTDIYGSSSNGSGNITGEEDPIFTNSPAADITLTDINNWNNKSDFSGDYEDLINIPNFSITAFSTDYSNLTNLPKTIINLSLFANSVLTEIENNKLQSLGAQSIYFLNYKNFTNAQNISLDNVIDEGINKYLYNDYQLYIYSLNYKFIINHIEKIYDENNNIIYYILSSIPISFSNYDNIRYSGNNIDDSICQSQLSQITEINQFPIFIIDKELNVLYYKLT